VSASEKINTAKGSIDTDYVWEYIEAGEKLIEEVSGIEFFLRYVPAGSFQRDYGVDNISVITKGYWMAETEVTQELFEAVMGANPGSTADLAEGEIQAKRPVDGLRWYGAIAFCNKLSLLAGKTPVYNVSGIDWATLAYSAIPAGSHTTWNEMTVDWNADGYRLPSEMEWMWAAMGADTDSPGNVNTTGHGKAFAGSTGSNIREDYAWTFVNADGKTHEVGKKLPNELGLYDMSGNQWEWTWDTLADYPGGELPDYTGPSSLAGRHIVRGGGVGYYLGHYGVSYRNHYALNNAGPTIRLVRNYKKGD
jgi:formylglycine-generating enzyme required for sulfatase activity